MLDQIAQGKKGLLAAALFLIACSSTPTPHIPNELSGPPALQVCAWNIKKLGHGSRKDYGWAAQIIRRHCDMVAVVEVMQKGGWPEGYERLHTALNTEEWRGVVTDEPRPLTAGGNAEYYAVFWMDGRVSPCSEPASLRIVEDPQDVFAREPAFGCWRCVGKHGVGVDFVLGVYHATWADGDTDVISEEVSHVREVFTQMEAAYPEEGDFFLVGDFNLRPEALRAASGVTDWDPGLATVEGSTLNSAGARTDNLYDHVLVLNPRASRELQGPAEVLDVRGPKPEAFYRRVSDHLPVRVRLRLDRSDDD